MGKMKLVTIAVVAALIVMLGLVVTVASADEFCRHKLQRKNIARVRASLASIPASTTPDLTTPSPMWLGC